MKSGFELYASGLLSRAKYQIETLSLEKHIIFIYMNKTQNVFKWGVGQVLDSPELKS
jgi:hypothetical protein